MESHASSLSIHQSRDAADDHRDPRNSQRNDDLFLRSSEHKHETYPGRSVTRMVGVTGFEPATSWSQTRRSTKLSYTPTDARDLPRSRA